MAPSSPALQQLARRLRDLREHQWSERLTQSALADAFGDVAAATVSSWESSVAPKLAPPDRLKAYAQFFATHRSIEGDSPVLLPVDTFSEEEQAARKALEVELLGLREEATRKPARQADVTAQRSWHFPDTGPLTIVCAIRVYRAVVVLREPGTGHRFELGLILAALVAAELSARLLALIDAAGGFLVWPVNPLLATSAQMPLPDGEEASRRNVIMIAAGGFAAVGTGIAL